MYTKQKRKMQEGKRKLDWHEFDTVPFRLCTNV